MEAICGRETGISAVLSLHEFACDTGTIRTVIPGHHAADTAKTYKNNRKTQKK